MIVNEDNDCFEIIFQRAHGMLAAKIAEKINPSMRPPQAYWLEILVAIADHDDGRRGWEGDFHIDEKGFPKNFTEFEFDHKQAERVINTAACKSRWVGLMISMHLVELYADLDNQEAQKLVQDQKEHQLRLLKQLAVSKEQAKSYYYLLKWSDELSLRICQKQFPEKGQRDYLERLPNGKDSFLKNSIGLSIDPWVFEEESAIFEIETRKIAKRPYKDDLDLQTELNKAEVKISSFEFKRGDV